LFSLRGNRLIYLPEEIGRLSRLKILNLSSNMLKHLPYSISKLKELQALWLAENQVKYFGLFSSIAKQKVNYHQK
jgi:leucine-rich repeat protein SHOC2